MTGERIMLDSTNPAAVIAAIRAGQKFTVPGGPQLRASVAALYGDGLYAATGHDWAALTGAGIPPESQVMITVTGSGGEAMKATAGDSEPGDMTPAQVAAWAHAERQAGHYPAPYCDRADKPKVIAECAKLGMHHAPHGMYGLWVATLDNTFRDLDGSDLRTQPGVLAIQFGQAHSPLWKGGPADLDVSLIVAFWWRAAVKPKPAPPPPPAVDGYLVSVGGAGGFAGRAVQSPPPPGAKQIWG